MELTGQHVVIIGGTSGIGLATAQRAASAGARVTVASRRQAGVDAALATLPAGASGRTITDTTSPAELDTFFAAAGPLDHLVYTAGEPLSLMPIADLDLEAARGFFTTRYLGALNTVRAALPRLAKTGSVTLTSGSAGARPGAGWALAASVCAAVEGLTRALAVELAPVRVNAVAPGVLRSPLWSGLPEKDRGDLYADVAASVPAGRVGEVDDVARAYVYAMTQGYGSGDVIRVDGGALLV